MKTREESGAGTVREIAVAALHAFGLEGNGDG